MNPLETWEYGGSFTIELTDDADMTIVPEDERSEDWTVHISDGYIVHSEEGLKVFSKGRQLGWGFSHIKVIRSGNGELLWINNYYRHTL